MATDTLTSKYPEEIQDLLRSFDPSLKLKHTPGVWSDSVVKDYNALAIFQKGHGENDCVADAICLISPVDILTEEDKANAALIGAAPELLSACLWLLEQLKRTEIKVSIYGWNQVLTALYKALNHKP
jgi:urea transporter